MSDEVLVERRGPIMVITINRPPAEVAAPVFSSADAKEGAAAFAEKRAPVWKGR